MCRIVPDLGGSIILELTEGEWVGCMVLIVVLPSLTHCQQFLKMTDQAFEFPVGRGEWIRTTGPCLPKAVLCQTELHPENLP